MRYVWDVLKASHEKTFFLRCIWDVLKNVTKKTSFRRCIWDVLKMSQKRHGDLTETSQRHLMTAGYTYFFLCCWILHLKLLQAHFSLLFSFSIALIQFYFPEPSLIAHGRTLLFHFSQNQYIVISVRKIFLSFRNVCLKLNYST